LYGFTVHGVAQFGTLDHQRYETHTTPQNCIDSFWNPLLYWRCSLTNRLSHCNKSTDAGRMEYVSRSRDCATDNTLPNTQSDNFSIIVTEVKKDILESHRYSLSYSWRVCTTDRSIYGNEIAAVSIFIFWHHPSSTLSIGMVDLREY